MVMSRAIKVDGKVRTEKCYPAGFMGAHCRFSAPSSPPWSRATRSFRYVSMRRAHRCITE